MLSIGNKPAKNVRMRERCAQQSRLAMVQARHRIKGMGNHTSALIKGLIGLLGGRE